MNAYGIQVAEKVRKDLAKRAVTLAMHSRWAEAVTMNEAILADFPRDLEAYNRLGKALSELGRNREAKASFQRALEISPNNSIAKKNLARLARLGDAAAIGGLGSSAKPDLFIEERARPGSLHSSTSPLRRSSPSWLRATRSDSIPTTGVCSSPTSPGRRSARWSRRWRPG